MLLHPARRLLQLGEQQQLVIRATYSDGNVRDVTSTAQYDSLNDSLAKVTPDGLVQALDRGETHIMVRYCGQAMVFQVTVPYTTVLFAAAQVLSGWPEARSVGDFVGAG